MIQKIFIDTDILLDIALAREPFISASSRVVRLIETKRAFGYISSSTITNLYYIFRKIAGDIEAREFLRKTLSFISLISITQADVSKSLESSFSDFEDALQHFCALRNKCDCIITKNVNDYKHSEIKVYTPIDFLSTYKKLYSES